MTIQPLVEVTEENFEDEVLRSPVPVLVDFWAQWCPPCRGLTPVVEEIAAERPGAVKVVKVNVDDSPELARRFKVRSVPLLLFFKDGEVRERHLGAANKKASLNKLEALI